MILLPFLITALATDSASGVPILDGCGEDAAIVITVPASEQITVHSGMAGEALPCYLVSVTLSGVEKRGYIVGTSLPAVQEFERRRALESRIPVPVPPSPPGEKPGDRTISPEEAGPLAGRQFPPWSGVDWNRKAVAIPGDAKFTLVAFLRPQVRAARLQAVAVSFITSKFSKRDLKSVGLIEGASLFNTRTYLEEMDVAIPLAADSSSLAKQFDADASKGTILILDSSSKVVASSTDSKKIQAMLTKLLAP